MLDLNFILIPAGPTEDGQCVDGNHLSSAPPFHQRKEISLSIISCNLIFMLGGVPRGSVSHRSPFLQSANFLCRKPGFCTVIPIVTFFHIYFASSGISRGLTPTSLSPTIPSPRTRNHSSSLLPHPLFCWQPGMEQSCEPRTSRDNSQCPSSKLLGFERPA